MFFQISTIFIGNVKFKSLNVKIRVFRGCYAAYVIQSAADGERSGPDILKGSSINSSVLMGVAQNMVRSILADKTDSVNFV